MKVCRTRYSKGNGNRLEKKNALFQDEGYLLGRADNLEFKPYTAVTLATYSNCQADGLKHTRGLEIAPKRYSRFRHSTSEEFIDVDGVRGAWADPCVDMEFADCPPDVERFRTTESVFLPSQKRRLPTGEYYMDAPIRYSKGVNDCEL